MGIQQPTPGPCSRKATTKEEERKDTSVLLPAQQKFLSLGNVPGYSSCIPINREALVKLIISWTLCKWSRVCSSVAWGGGGKAY